MLRMLRIWAAVGLIVVSGCDWTVFDEFETTAPVIAISPSDDFASETFGLALTAWSGDLGGRGVSRLGVSGGENTPYAAYVGWDGQAFRPGDPVYEGCQGNLSCGGAGVSLAGVPSWQGEELCLFITAPGAGLLRVRCETGSASTRVSPGSHPGEELGASIVGLSSVQQNVVVVVGAPALGGELGGVYAVENDPDPLAFSLSPMTLMNTEGAMRPVDGRFGETLAAGVVLGETRVAVGAGGLGLVAIGRIDPGNTLFIEGCVRSADAAEALAMGDTDGDGSDELIVLRNGQIAVYAIAGISGGCGPAAPDTALQQSFACAGCTTMTTGDVNGDGADELIAGAPGRTVRGEADAGAIEIFCGSVGSGFGSTPCATLTHSTPVSGAALGTQVAAVQSGLGSAPRAEPVASAPGEDRLYFFTCSGISGDGPGAEGACVAR